MRKKIISVHRNEFWQVGNSLNIHVAGAKHERQNLTEYVHVLFAIILQHLLVNLSDPEPHIIFSKETYGLEDALPLPFTPPDVGEVTSGWLSDGDLNTCLHFPKYGHSFKMLIRLDYVTNSSIEIRGKGFDCQNIVVGLQAVNSIEKVTDALGEFSLCSVEELLSDMRICHSKCTEHYYLMKAVIMIESSVEAEVCEFESEMFQST